MARVVREYSLKETGAKIVHVVVSNNEQLAKFEPKQVFNENVCVYIVGDNSTSSAEKERIRDTCINFKYIYMGLYIEKVPVFQKRTSEKGATAEKKEESSA